MANECWLYNSVSQPEVFEPIIYWLKGSAYLPVLVGLKSLLKTTPILHQFIAFKLQNFFFFKLQKRLKSLSPYSWCKQFFSLLLIKTPLLFIQLIGKHEDVHCHHYGLSGHRDRQWSVRPRRIFLLQSWASLPTDGCFPSALQGTIFPWPTTIPSSAICSTWIQFRRRLHPIPELPVKRSKFLGLVER